MALQAPEVRVGITGEMFSAPLGSGTPPSDASSSLDAVFIGHGYVTDDGVTESHEDSTNNVVAWQNAQVIRAMRSESVATLGLSLLQTRGSNLELFHPGSSVESDGNSGFKIEVVPPIGNPRQFVLNVVDGTELIRIYVGNGEVTERGEIPYSNSDAVMYPLTITCYPDASGNLMTKFSNSAAWGYDIGS